MIPKIIHQTWKTLDVPNKWKDTVESCKNIHKDYDFLKDITKKARFVQNIVEL